MVNLIKISLNGEMSDININLENNYINQFESLCKYKGYNDICKLYKWNYDNNEILIYGWTKGEQSNKNQHNLPNNGEELFKNINSNDINLYGDIIIIKQNSNNEIIDIDSSEYGEFYNIMYNYYDDMDLEEYTSEEDDNIENNLLDIIKTETDNLNNLTNNLTIDLLGNENINKSTKSNNSDYLDNMLIYDTNDYLNYKKI